MGTDAHGRKEGVARTLHRTMHFQLVDGVPSFLPMDPSGHPIPFEVFALEEFYQSRTHGAEPPASDAAATSETTSVRIPLPTLHSLAVPPRRFLERILIKGSADAAHAFALMRLTDPLVFECGIVFRPEHRYAFVGAFLHCFPPFKTVQRRRNCYHIRCVSMEPGHDLRSLASGVVREEVESLRAGIRSPLRPHFGDLRPLLESSTTSIEDGAVEHTIDWVRRRSTLSWSEEDVAALPGPARRVAKQLLSRPTIGGPFKRGGVPSLAESELRAAYVALLPICEKLLANLPRPAWPAFSTLDRATSYVAEFADGPPEHIRPLARLLLSGRRRPAASALAVTVLHKWTGLSKDWIRRLRRD